MVSFEYSFNDGAFLNIKDDNDKDGKNVYGVEFINQDTEKVEFKIDLRSNHWAKTGKKFYVDWLIRVKFENNIVFEKKIDLKEQEVCVFFDSKALGDNIGWMPMVEKFRITHNLDKIYCSTFFNDYFKKIYPNIIFIEPNTKKLEDFLCSYMLGYFDKYDNLNRNVTKPFGEPLQKVAADILGIKDWKEIHSSIYRKKSERKIEQKYVCIAEHSTAQCKYWNNPTGWQDVVNYLKSKGYLVYSLSRETGEYMGNKPLEGVIKPEDSSLDEAMNLLEHCEFFIGLSSGLSWVAWALKVKVIMISGFTEPFMEFLTGCIRLHNDDVCNGCMNKPNEYEPFDPGDWNWCPRYKETFNHFICSKSITAQEVIENIEKIEDGTIDITPYNEILEIKHLMVDKVDNVVKPDKVEIHDENSIHYIRISSTSLGDTISWVPYAEEYRKKHNVKVYVSTHWNNLFVKSFPNLKFIKPEEDASFTFEKRFLIDYYPLTISDKDLSMFDNPHMVDYRTLPIQLIAPNALGLPMIEIDGKIDEPDRERNIKGKYVVIALQSTAQLKYWNNPIGWERVFDYLKNNGYKIVIIDKEKSFGVKGYFNQAPKVRGLIDKTGNIDLADRIVDIKNADMMITLSTGLAWMAWALNTPTIMISGFTKPWNEFKKNIKRIHNDSVCNGCWNDTSSKFDTWSWLFCPKNKDFVCSKSIQPAEVIRAIKEIELEKNSVNIPNSKGELVDKVTILQIKLENIKDNNKTNNIRKEYNELKRIMESEIDILEEDEDYQDLLEINRKLWKIEDDIRDKERKKQFDEEFIELARSVYFTNDERSNIKKRINISEGSSLIEEKSYQKYK